MKNKYIVIVFVLFAVMLIVYQLYCGNVLENFAGTDDQSVGIIKDIAPNYKPWFKHVITFKSDLAEPLFFTLQATLGLGIFGLYIIKRQKKQ